MKTLRIWVVIGVACAWASGSLGQIKDWDRTFGGSLEDNARSIQQTADGGYILGGNSKSGANGDKTQESQGFNDYWIVKVDATGAMQWDKRFGGDQDDTCTFVLQTADGSYILGGDSSSDANGDKTEGSQGSADYWIVKVDATGTKQWDRRFGGSGPDAIREVQQTADDGYILGGVSWSGADGDKTEGSRGGADYWIVKVDAFGNKQWDKRFGGSSEDQFQSLQQTADGGYILGGYSSSDANGDKTENSRGGADYWIVKVDATGTKQWDKRFGGSMNDELRSLRQTADGGYILGGDSTSGADGDKTESSRGQSDYWIVKVNANGTKQWDKRFGGSGFETFGGVRQTADGGYILGGTADSGVDGDKTDTSRGVYDYWIVKVNAQGIKRWDRTFGGTTADWLNGGIRQTGDGGYIFGGASVSDAGGDKTEASRGSWDFWIVKMAVQPGDAYEPDDNQGSAKTIANGVTQARSIHERGDIDQAKFVVGAAGAQNASIETSGTTGDTELWVYRGLGGPLVAHNGDISAANKFSRVTLASLAAGTYYIKVGAYGNNIDIEAYSLRARWTQNYAPDRYEPDNSRTAAKRIRNGKTQSRTIHRAGNRDWAKFTIGSRGARKVRIQTSGASGDTVMRLYNRAGQRLAIDDDSGPGKFSRIRKATLPAGTYYLRIEEKGNNGTLPAYKLYIKWIPL